MRTEPTFDLRAYLSEKKTIVDRALEACLPEPEGLTGADGDGHEIITF